MVRNGDETQFSGEGLAKNMPLANKWGNGPEGALIPDETASGDKIAVVYSRGENPPTITISNLSGGVQTVMANGIAVAIVARAEGPKLTVDDVLLVERFVTTPN